MSPRLVVFVAVLAAACAGAMRGPAPPLPRPGEPIAAWKRPTADGEATVLYARNDTTFAIVATFHLFACVNIDHPCGDITPGRTLEPGVIVEIDTLRPVDVFKDHTFNFSFTARPQ
jgi:hypothetical protein